MDQVIISEVCPRDGFQILPVSMPTGEKVKVINDLMECGFKQIEVTSFVHPKAVPQLSDADEVLREITRKEGVRLRALIPNLRGLDRAIKAEVDVVKLMLSATDSHSLHNANSKTFDAMAEFGEIKARADEAGIVVEGSISVAFGCPYEGVVPVERHLEICERYDQLAIRKISLADTTGMANPVRVKEIIRELKQAFPHFTFSLHLHNTRGMAFANALAGYEEGIRDFDSAAGGLGGCPYAPNASGNIASEDLIHGFMEMGIETAIDLDRVIDVAKNLRSQYPNEVDSFILKAGKASDLHLAPGKQKK